MYDLVSWSQAGFRKHNSTADNLFIIKKSLIDIEKARKQKLFCYFNDFTQAFDTVWHKDFGSIYEKVKSMASVLTLYTFYTKTVNPREQPRKAHHLFNCTLGIKQGEILSPFSFLHFLK